MPSFLSSNFFVMLAGKKIFFWKRETTLGWVFVCLLATCLAVGVPQAAQAEALHPTLEVACDGDACVAALHIVIPREFHAYAHEPGEAGRPTNVSLSIGDGDPLPVYYPEGTLQRDYYDPTATVSVYEGKVVFFIPLPSGSAGKAYRAAVSLLLCSSRTCLPVHERFSGFVPQQAQPLEKTSWQASWRAMGSPRGVPGGAGPMEGTDRDGNGMAQSGELAPPVSPSPDSLPPLPSTFHVQLTPRYLEASQEVAGLGMALLFGMLAGLLLNVMPCVLPVLTFKVSGLLLCSGRGAAGQRRFRQHNLCFAAGIMTLFSALAVILGMADLMWGQLYQNQAILLVMLILVFLMALSGLGVFHLPVIDMKIGTKVKNPCLAAYATGLVSTFLATPCSGPLLGGVLAWAFTQPFPVLMAVFWAIGMGMALPYLLFSAWPALVQIVPKPGAWMQAFERIVGFLLLGTALYLMSLLPTERHMPVLTILLALAFCVWLWGRYGAPAPPLRRSVFGFLTGLVLLASLVWVLQPVAPLPQWRSLVPQRFEAELGKKSMLLEFTADWCPNCKFLEATVLTGEHMRRLQAQYGMELVRVDLTRADAYGMRLLQALGSRSLPLTALFPSGEAADRPLVLRDVYSLSALERGLREIFSE